MKLDNALRANRIIVTAALICITALAAVLRLYDLERAGLGNLFYASTVYSMGLSVSNFLYAAYDPLGTFIVDKPPVALWFQVIFSKLIGFSGLAMILPMALASTAAVPLLYVTSKRAFGTGIGLLAAVIFAVLPVSVATARDSSMDPMLMLFLLVSVLFLQRAVEKCSLRLLIVWAILMGVAFNVKYFQAFIVLPASAIYILTSWRESLRPALIKWGLAGIVLLIVSLSWALAVDMVPSDSRPRVMNDPDDSVIGLILRYNGLNRALPQDVVVFLPPQGTSARQAAGLNQTARLFGTGNRGLGRLLGGSNGPLLGVTAILAIYGLVGLGFMSRKSLRGPPLFWFAWGGTGLIIFILGNRSPVHYFESFSPAIAVLAAFAIVGLVKVNSVQHRIPILPFEGHTIDLIVILDDLYELIAPIVTRVAWSMPFLLVIGFGFLTVMDFPALQFPTSIAASTALIGTMGLVLISFVSISRIVHTLLATITIAGLIAIPLVSSTWITLVAPRGDAVVTMPNPLEYAREGGRRPKASWAGGAAAMSYALERSDTEYILAVDSFARSGELIAKFRQPILPVWNLWLRSELYDQESLQSLIENGRVRYFLTRDRTDSYIGLDSWVWLNCTNVGVYEYAVNEDMTLLNALNGQDILWDCSPFR